MNTTEKLRTALEVTWRVLRSLLLIIGAVLLVTAGCLFVWNKVSTQFTPLNTDDPQPQEIYISRGTSVKAITQLLEEKKIIRSARAYKLYLDFTGQGPALKAGYYWLDDGMTFQQISEKMAKGDSGRSVVNLLVKEGSTVEQLAKNAVAVGLFESEDHFLQLCRDGSLFAEEYDFVNDIYDEDGTDRYYLLEGYLFPAKYELYADTDEKTVIRKLLGKFSTVMNATFMERAEELDMSVDEVITLASLIEKEAKTKDFAKVSAVFHNRLREEMPLGSDVTIQYITHSNSLLLSDNDTAVESPYNTYKVTGLPLGPICNPGLDAIEAALYPDEEYIKENYLYFILTDPETGELEFNKTLAAHELAKAKYQPLWEEYQEKQQNGDDSQP